MLWVVKRSGLLKDDNMDEEEEDEDKDDTDDSTKVESNEVVTAENLEATPATVVVKMVDGKEVVVTDMDESLKIQNEARNMLKMLHQVMVYVSNVTEISNVTNVIVPPNA